MEFSNISSVLISLVAVLSLLYSIYAHQGDRIEDYLNAHNVARRAVGNKEVTWDPKLEAYAKEYASKHLHDCQLIHTGGPYGENLAMGWGMVALDAVAMWVYEKKNFNYQQNACDPLGSDCEHYLQTVWNTTERIGCHHAKCQNGADWIGCNYDPRPQGQRGFSNPADPKLD